MITHKEAGIKAVIFTTKSTSKQGKLMVHGVTIVDPDWVEEMSGNATKKTSH